MVARTLPPVTNWFAGQKLTATAMNAIATWQSFWANPPMIRAYQSVGQVVANTIDAQVTLDSVSGTSGWDTDSGRSGTTPYSFIIPPGMTGRWDWAYVVAYPINVTGARACYLKSNGTRISGSTYEIGANNDAAIVGGTCTALCNAGDVISLWTWQNSGVSLTLTTPNSMLEGRLVSLATP